MGDAALVGQEPRQLAGLVGRPVPHHVVAALPGAAGRCRGRRPDSPDTARRAAGRTPSSRTARDGSPAGSRSRAAARAKPRSRHKAAQRRAGIAGAPSSAGRRRRSGRRPPPRGRRSNGQRRRRRLCSNAVRPTPAMIALRREGIAQHAVDALPGRQHLRTFDGRGRLARPRSRILRVVIATPRSLRVEAERVACRAISSACATMPAPRPAQLAVDALENIDVPAAPRQHDAGQQPAHRAADDRARGAAWFMRQILLFPAFASRERFSILCQ